MIEHSQVIQAAEMMPYKSRPLEEGDFTLISIGNMFIDCVDHVT